MPLLLLALLLAACNNAVEPGSVTSGIQGRVTIGPQCPVVMAGSPCPDAPLAATITVSSTDGQEVASIETPRDGTFRIALAPGTYVVEARPLQGDGIARMLPLEPVHVVVDTYSTVPISFDSGIR
jgi:hypothetical protein